MDSSELARFFAVLLTTEEHDLEAFRRRFLGRDSDLPLERLELVRRTLLALGEAAMSSSDQRWDAVAKAEQALANATSSVDSTLVAGGISVDASSLSDAVVAPVGKPNDAGSSPWTKAPAAATPLSRAPAVRQPPSAAAIPVSAIPFEHGLHPAPPSESPEPAPAPVQVILPKAASAGGERNEPKEWGTLGLEFVAVDFSGVNAATPFRRRTEPEEKPSSDKPRLDALPFAALQSSRAPRGLSVEQFAWIAANVERLGERAPFGPESGIESLEAWRVVEKEWRDYTEDRHELRQRIDELMGQYREWLARGG